MIPQKELRNNVGEVLRRAEAGEEFTVTVSAGRSPGLDRHRLASGSGGPALQRVWETPAPETLADDLLRLSRRATRSHT